MIPWFSKVLNISYFPRLSTWSNVTVSVRGVMTPGLGYTRTMCERVMITPGVDTESRGPEEWGCCQETGDKNSSVWEEWEIPIRQRSDHRLLCSPLRLRVSSEPGVCGNRKDNPTRKMHSAPSRYKYLTSSQANIMDAPPIKSIPPIQGPLFWLLSSMWKLEIPGLIFSLLMTITADSRQSPVVNGHQNGKQINKVISVGY